MTAPARLHSPTALVAFTACVHRTELERARDAGLVKKPYYENSALDALALRGDQHEKECLEEFRKAKLDIVEVNKSLDVESAAKTTEAAMLAGAGVIYQAAFLQRGWRGYADFLVRVGKPSKLGAWSYEPQDAKLSREPKPSALIQLCGYAEMIEEIQRTPPEFVHILLGGPDRRRETVRLDSIAPYYRRVRRDFHDHFAKAKGPVFPIVKPYPEPVEYCEVCDWLPVCEERWHKDDYVALVAGITRNQRRALSERGIGTLAGLAGAPLPFTPPLERTSTASVARVREQARVQMEGREKGKPVYELIDPVESGMGLEALPAPADGDLFFDIEGDPFVGDAGREYLFGLADAGGDYTCSWALDAESESVEFEKLVDRFTRQLKKHPGMHVYHYAHYEPSALKRLAARLARRVEEVDALLRAQVFVDLFRVVRQGIRASVESYSIKRLEPFYAFTRGMDLRVAGDARAALEVWLETGGGRPLEDQETICERVRVYNKDDCLSALKLRNWLEKRRSELAKQRGRPVPRPTAPEPPAEDSSQKRAELEALRTKLLEGLPVEGRTPEQNAQWLVAHLLQWHAREEKSVWWDFFRMCELSQQELIGDGTPIGGLEYVGEVGQVKKSTVHRYSFPPQEHDIEEGSDCREPHTNKNHKVFAIDPQACTLDIKCASKQPPPDVTALIPLQVVKAPAQQARLRALADWVAEQGVASRREHRLALDLLKRVPPPRTDSVQRPGEEASDAAVRVALELAESKRGGVLPIQGPPGSGKTYTGARMMLELVREGLKVGVVANSHKVIENLLKKACELARERKMKLGIVQKPNDGGGLDDPFVTICGTNLAMQQSLDDPAFNVFAGTAWMWAAMPPGRIDVLFIDEAAQVSLANVVPIADSARCMVLLGDPMQLDQPHKGVHPPGCEVSALEHLVGTPGATMPPDRGIFLDRTWRLNPALCEFTSRTFYESRLQNRAETSKQQLKLEGKLGGAGIRWWPIEHAGNQNESVEEVAAVKKLFDAFLKPSVSWIDDKGFDRPLTINDILVVAPYNAQVRALNKTLPPGARVGTVDKFQGQQAPVAIYSMTTSTREDAPRGMDFLYSLNRLNVATSRAQCVAIVVASPALLRPLCRTPLQMRQASALCAVVEYSVR